MTPRSHRTVEQLARLVDLALSGERAALAKVLTEIERGEAGAEQIDRLLPRAPSTTRTIGFTGAPGVGKSTLLGALLMHLADKGERAAAVMVDPSSPISGGALLGDRLRMPTVSARPEIFVRSMASRGRAGGLSDMTRRAARCLEACGWPNVFIETVGIGQVDVDVATVADVVVVVLNPGAGDEVQMFKAGLMEVADVFVINKADHPSVKALRQDLSGMIASIPRGVPRPAVVETIASSGEGIRELADALWRYLDESAASGKLADRREQRVAREVADLATGLFLRRLKVETTSENFDELCARVLRGKVTAHSAAMQLLGVVTRELLIPAEQSVQMVRSQ